MKILNKFGLKEMFDFEDGRIPILQRGLRICLEAQKTDPTTFENKYPELFRFVNEYFAVKLKKSPLRIIPQDMITALKDKTAGIIKNFPPLANINPYFLSLNVDQLAALRKDAERFDRDFTKQGSQVVATLRTFFTEAAVMLKQGSVSRKSLFQALQGVADPSFFSIISKELDKYSLCADNGEITFS